MDKKRVYIVGEGINEYAHMFENKGWTLSSHIWGADMIQFIGGADVDPKYYGHKEHSSTNSWPARDRKEKLIFMLALKDKIPMSGICRGGQFLNVMNGGWMWQDCNGHATGKMHNVIDQITGEGFAVTSTHHQMMKPHPTGMVIGLANECLWKERMAERVDGEPINTGNAIRTICQPDTDVEIVYYKETNSFCFQPHPEFAGFNGLSDRYFNYLYEYLGV